MYLCASKTVAMKNIKEFLIPFLGLKLGKHQFEYQIDESFFEYFEYDDFDSVNIKVYVVLEKKSTMLEFILKHEGTVNIPCDLTGELFNLPIQGSIKFIVQFGEAYNDDHEELLILPYKEHQVNISQYIYEMIVLSVPAKRICSEVQQYDRNTEILKKTEKISFKEQNIDNKDNKTDPRWDVLKRLLTD